MSVEFWILLLVFLSSKVGQSSTGQRNELSLWYHVGLPPVLPALIGTARALFHPVANEEAMGRGARDQQVVLTGASHSLNDISGVRSNALGLNLARLSHVFGDQSR